MPYAIGNAEAQHVAAVLREAGIKPSQQSELLVARGNRRVYRAGGTIVRLWYGRSGGDIARSGAALRALAGVALVPQLIYQCTTRPQPPYQAQVTTCLPGETLEQAWPGLDLAARRDSVAQLATQMRALHSLGAADAPELAALDAALPWAQRCRERLATYLALAQQSNEVDQQDLAQIAEFIARHQHLLDQAQPLRLIHTDIHFGNIMIHNGKLTGLIDFELAEIGGRDRDAYMLIGDSLGQLLRGGGDDPASNQTLQAVGWLQEEYPELYADPGFSARQMLYLMLEPDDWGDHDIAAKVGTWINVLASGAIDRWFS